MAFPRRLSHIIRLELDPMDLFEANELTRRLLFLFPALIDPDTFALAQERLESNKKHASRRTIEPSILRDIVHCRECGYALIPEIDAQ